MGCRGKDDACVLHVFIAQVRKLRVRSFIVADFGCGWAMRCRGGVEGVRSWSRALDVCDGTRFGGMFR